MATHAPTHIVHLAGLQVPFVAADPVLGALVNVAGTVRVLEAARHSGGTVRGVAYASSAAVYDPSGELRPRTLYGVFKRCNEETARHYAEALGVPSVGLRPWTVFGVGRDQGVTSAPTSAIQAVVRGETYEIPFTGSMAMQYTADVAAAFVAAARAHPAAPASYDLPGVVMTVDEVIAGIESAVPGAQRPHHEHRRPAADRGDHAGALAARARPGPDGDAVRRRGRADRGALRRARRRCLTPARSVVRGSGQGPGMTEPQRSTEQTHASDSADRDAEQETTGMTDSEGGSGTAGPDTETKKQAGSYARDAEQDPERERHGRADADR